MQIIQPPLGIKNPLLGLSSPLSLPKLLFRKELSTFRPLGVIKPLATIPGRGLPRFLPLSKSSKLLPALTSRSLTEWNTEVPPVAHEPLEQTKEERDIANNNQEPKVTLQRSWSDQAETDLVGQSSAKLTTQKKVKSKKYKKQIQSKPSPKSKKAVTSATAEKVHQSPKEIGTSKRVNDNAQTTVPEPISDMPDFEGFKADTLLDIQQSSDTPQDSDFIQRVPIPAKLAPLTEEDRPTLLESFIESGEVASVPLATVINPEVLTDNQTPGPPQAINVENTASKSSESTSVLLDSTTAESVESLPILAAPPLPAQADKPTSFISDGEQPVAAETLPVMSNIEVFEVARSPSVVEAITSSSSTSEPAGESSESAPALAAPTLINKKRAKSKSRSKTRSKKAATVAAEQASQSLNEISTVDGINSDEWVAASKTPPTGASSKVLRTKQNLTPSQQDSDSGSITAKSTESVRTLVALILPTEGDSSTLFTSLADTGQATTTTEPPAIPNSEVLDVNQSHSVPQQIINSKSIVDDAKSASTPLESTTDGPADTESQPVLAESTLPTGDRPTLFKSMADGEQLAVTEPLPAMPNPKVPDGVGVKDIQKPEALQRRVTLGGTTGEVNTGSVVSPDSDSSLLSETFGNDTGIDQYTSSAEVGRDTTFDTSPPKGFATSEPVAASHTLGSQQVAHSDTVPAMLTPGEFVINVTQAQKNLNLLQHINSGSQVVEELLPFTTQTPQSREPEAIASTETYTKVESLPGSSVQRKSSDVSLPMSLHPLVQVSPSLETEQQSLSTLRPLQSNPVDHRADRVDQASNHYAPTSLIFRKQTPVADSPSQWSSVEDLLSEGISTGSFDEFAPLNFGSENSNRRNSDFRTPESPRVSPSPLPSPRGFATGGEVMAPDPATAAQPVAETIARPLSAAEEDFPDLEVLAREIYGRLRQRLELERERHGLYSGRLPW